MAAEAKLMATPAHLFHTIPPLPTLLFSDSSTSQALLLGCFNRVTQQKRTQQGKKQIALPYFWMLNQLSWTVVKAVVVQATVGTRAISVPLFPLGNFLTACIKEKMPIPTKT